jgi:hypothetical protein
MNYFIVSLVSLLSLVSHGFSLGRLLTATPPVPDALGGFELGFGTGTAPVSFSTSLNGTSFAFPAWFVSNFPIHNGSPPTSCDTI